LDQARPRRVSRPVRDILRYFLRNFATADSLEGIARWRLLEEGIYRNLVETRTALDWLLKEGYLVEVPGAQAVRLLRLNPDKRDEAQMLLERTGRKPAQRRTDD
jgi:hypothetical protein